jgi:hypothetical protein
VKNALRQIDLTCPIAETKVGDQERALQVGFLGSTTIDGLDKTRHTSHRQLRHDVPYL